MLTCWVAGWGLMAISWEWTARSSQLLITSAAHSANTNFTTCHCGDRITCSPLIGRDQIILPPWLVGFGQSTWACHWLNFLNFTNVDLSHSHGLLIYHCHLFDFTTFNFFGTGSENCIFSSPIVKESKTINSNFDKALAFCKPVIKCLDFCSKILNDILAIWTKRELWL